MGKGDSTKTAALFEFLRSLHSTAAKTVCAPDLLSLSLLIALFQSLLLLALSVESGCLPCLLLHFWPCLALRAHPQFIATLRALRTSRCCSCARGRPPSD